jgi:glycosyltransferase involved in cell wall biosynthesis
MKKRLAILVGVPTPYREPLFERLAASDSLETLVLYCRERQPGQNWFIAEPRYAARYLKNYAPESWHGRFLICAFNPGIVRALTDFQPDALVVYGYNSVSALLGIVWARLHKIPFLLRSDSNILDEQAKSWPLRRVKNFLLGILTQKAAAVLAVGTLNRDYWRAYGAAPERIVPAYYAVNNHFFSVEANRCRSRKGEIRREKGWSEAFLVLYVGRLVREKRVDILIQSLRQLSQTRSDVGLVIVGDGPERKRLMRLAEGMPHIYFAGFQDQCDLPNYYGVTDLLVLPSEQDSWGLVVNEAMASGLPVVATQKVGAAHDLIIDGENGYVVRDNDVGALASAIDRACGSRQHLQSLGERAQQVVQSWNFDATLAGFHKAISLCLGC